MKYDVVIIGGGPAGIVAGMTAKKYYSKKKILVIKSIGNGVVPCAIPYMFKTLKTPNQNALGNAPLINSKINVETGTVNHVNLEKKELLFEEKKVHYDKLIFATGSNPIMPPIEGIEKMGIYVIKKDMDYLKNLDKDIKKSKNIVIIGGGFIGVEFADELAKSNAKITIVEFANRIFANSFDEEFSNKATEILKNKKIKLMTGVGAKKFLGDHRVNSVELSDGKILKSDLVILGVGAIPNSELAKNSGLEVNKRGGIITDEYSRTSHNDVFAVGDCAAKTDYFTRKPASVMLASTACSEGRIAGSNLYELKVVKENRGAIAAYSTKIGETSFASVGLTESLAKKEGFEVIIGRNETVDRHPGTIPNANKIFTKLVFSKQSELLIGAQIFGGDSIGEIINVLALAIQKNTTLTELETLQLATHPMLTAAPTNYPIISAAQDALKNV